MKNRRINKLRQRLLGLVVRCVQCAQVWRVLNLRLGEMHICKDCNHRFVVDERAVVSPGASTGVAGVL